MATPVQVASGPEQYTFVLTPERKRQLLDELERMRRAITPGRRLREAGRVFARHGLRHLLEDRELFRLFGKRHRTGDENEMLRRVGRRLRLAFEELGPTYIKLGQVLVTRQELIPEPITEELKKLLDSVPPMPFPYIAAVLDEQLPDGLHTFEWIDPEPIASASLAQVYRAQLKDGRLCAVKVVRPLVDKLFQTDIGNIRKLVKRVQKLLPPAMAASADLPGLINDYYSSAMSELDMRLEARNTEEGKRLVEEFATLAVPDVYLATERVLILEYVDGWNIKEFPVDFLTFEERFEIMMDLAHYYIKAFLEGLYHADPHGSNLMICRHTKKCYVIDWGMVGRMDAIHTEALFRSVLHIRANQAEDFAEVMLDVYPPTVFTDVTKFRDQLRALAIHYVTSEQASDRNWGDLVMKTIQIAMENHCRIPSGLALWAKGWSAAEGTARWLCPEISYHYVVESADVRILRSWLSRRFNYRTNASLLAETLKLVATLPRRLNKILERLAWNDFRLIVENRVSPDMLQVANRMVNRATLGVMASGFFVGASVLLAFGGPALAAMPAVQALLGWVLWGSTATAGYVLWRVLRSHKA